MVYIIVFIYKILGINMGNTILKYVNAFKIAGVQSKKKYKELT